KNVGKPIQKFIFGRIVSTVAWKQSFQQFILNKRHKYSIKLYMLCEMKGFLLNIFIYIGSRDQEVGGSHPKSCEEVARFMQMLKIFTTRTLHPSQNGNPPNVISRKLKKVKVYSEFTKEGLCVSKWRDRRDNLTISTEFNGDIIHVRNGRGEESKKPIYDRSNSLLLQLRKESSEMVYSSGVPHYSYNAIQLISVAQKI
ncbi:hypothetical protein J437_LFUL019399, partial [Ladona fulva]